jgi:hypothetical protein
MAPLPYDSEDGASRLAILGRALLVVVLLLEGLYLVDLARPGACLHAAIPSRSHR